MALISHWPVTLASPVPTSEVGFGLQGRDEPRGRCWKRLHYCVHLPIPGVPRGQEPPSVTGTVSQGWADCPLPRGSRTTCSEWGMSETWGLHP